jgi:hypothetical protein
MYGERRGRERRGTGCAQYSKAAECFSTAASIGIPGLVPAEERWLNKALDCGFEAQKQASGCRPLAEAKGFEIRHCGP